MKAIGIFVSVIFVLFVLTVISFLGGWAVEGNNFFMYKFFAPKEAEVQREVFQHSRPFVEGKIDELNKEEIEYVQATADQKPGLAALILHQAQDVSDEDLTPDLRSFLHSLKGQQLGNSLPTVPSSNP